MRLFRGIWHTNTTSELFTCNKGEFRLFSSRQNIFSRTRKGKFGWDDHTFHSDSESIIRVIRWNHGRTDASISVLY